MKILKSLATISIILPFIAFGHEEFSFYETPDLIRIESAITIDKSQSDVFEIVKDTMKDKIWRSEVNEMTSDGPFEIGTIYTEDARIGLNRNFITRTQLLHLEDAYRAYYETPSDEPYFLSSERIVEVISENKSRFIYNVEFDAKMSKKAIGFNAPSGIMKWYYKKVIKSYQRRLREYFRRQ